MKGKTLVAYSAAAVAVGLLMGCGARCENEVHEVSVSPAQDFKAVLFSRSCGATTGFNTQVSVVPSSASALDESGNVLVMDGQSQVRMSWRAERELAITGLNSDEVFKRATEVNGVAIFYE